MMTLAVRMARHRLTSLVAVALAALGGAALVTATGVLTESGLRSHSPVGRLAGADVVVTAPQTVRAPESIPAVLPERHRLDADVAARLADVPGVRHAVGDVAFPAALVGDDGRVVELASPDSAGHGWSSVGLLGDRRANGTPPTTADEVALGSTAAEAAGASVGDEVRIAADGRTPTTFLVSAVLPGGGDHLFFADRPGPTVDLVGLRVGDPDAVESVASAVERSLRGTGLVVATGAERGDTVTPGDTAARSMLLLVAGSLAGIVVMLVGFVVTGAVSVSVAGQRRSLALIRSIGGTPRQVRSLVAGEATAVTALAVVPGVALGYVVAGQLGRLLRAVEILPAGLPLTYGPLPGLVGAVAMVAVVQLAARAASWRTSRAAPVEALVESSTEAREPSRLRERIGLLVVLGAIGLAVTPVLVRSEIGAAATSTAGILAAIGLAVAGPGLLRRLGDATGDRLPARTSAPTWLAVTNLRVFSSRFGGVITASAMLVVFTLTYALSQTTLLTATSDAVRDGTVADVRVTADRLGGVPRGLADELGTLDGVRGAAPVSTTSVVWPHTVLGDVEIEAEPAMILTPDASDVLDLDVHEGSLADLEGDTIAVGVDVARSRDAAVGSRVRLTLGDGTEVRPRVVATYDRQLAFGPVVLSRDLAEGHTTTGLDESVLVRTDGTDGAREALAGLATSRPGLDVGDTGGDTSASVAAPGLLLNVATLAVLLGYLALTIANRIVAMTTQRRGEITALRLAGATRGQVLAMTRRESLIAAGVAIGAALAVTALPLAFLGIGFLGRPWPSGPVWLVPATALLVVGLVVTAVEVPTRRLLRPRGGLA
jgi:putative ABC transport system permease protein